jgi:hypothetical protein
VGDGDAVRASGGQPCLDRGADVIGVDVDVPQPVAADHDERVAEPVEGRPQRRHPVVVGLQQIHDLVRRPALDEIVAGGGGRHRHLLQDPLGHAAGEGLLGGVEHDHQGTSAGVDDAGPGESLHLHRRAGESLTGGLTGSGERDPTVGRLVDGGLGATCSGRGDRQDRALDRTPDRGVRSIGRGPERPRDVGRGQLLVQVEAAEAGPHELGHDDAAVALGAEEQPVGVGLDQDGELDVGPEGPHGIRPRHERQVRIGARVAVRHREDVEGVDLGPGVRQCRDTLLRPRPELVRAQREGHGARLPIRVDRTPSAILERLPAGGPSQMTRPPRARSFQTYLILRSGRRGSGL